MWPGNKRFIFVNRGLAVVVMLLVAGLVHAQTPSFTYQGRLTDGGVVANGNYDLQFSMFDNLSGGSQIGTTQTLSNVAVSAGIFTVQLDFGAGAFPGANRFLEIRARLAGGPSYTTLAPRQPITSTPYAVRSLNASFADAVTVNGVPGGSGNYVQNTASPQAASNFNISGNGTAGGTLSASTVNATTQYNIGGDRLLSVSGTYNFFAGRSAGQANTTGDRNTFFGSFTGEVNTTGFRNTFFGAATGFSNTTGTLNAFFGDSAGDSNTTGDRNAFFGSVAGQVNSGSNNSFFGTASGLQNGTGSNNSFFGDSAGNENASGNQNAFFGYASGNSNIAGSKNTTIGSGSNFGSGNLTNGTAIGANARVDQSNSLVLGSIAGVNLATSSVNVGIGTTTPLATLDTRGTMLVSGDVGVGTTTPTAKLDIRVNSALIRFSGVNCGSNFGAITFGNVALGCSNYSLLGEGINTFINRPAGGALLFRENNNDQMVIQAGGNVVINGRGEFGSLLKLDQIDSGLGAGTVQLCRNAALVIAVCTSSSLRYKEQIGPFSGGLNLLRRLRPISFTWKMDGSRDLGLGAEDVARVEPLLITRNDKGEIEGVRYDRLNVVLINAIKEQQKQIETLSAANTALNKRLQWIEKVLQERVGPGRHKKVRRRN